MSGEELKELRTLIANMFDQNASMLELMFKQQEQIDRLSTDVSKLTASLENCHRLEMPVRSAKPDQHILVAESANKVEPTPTFISATAAQHNSVAEPAKVCDPNIASIIIDEKVVSSIEFKSESIVSTDNILESAKITPWCHNLCETNGQENFAKFDQ